MTPSRWQIHSQHTASFGSVAPVLWLLTGAAVAAWAYFSMATPERVRHFLVLHQGLETLSIVVSALVFAVGWKAHSINPQRNVFILACGFLGVALLDFSHMLSYAGMPDYVTANSVAKGINFWLPARYLVAVSLLWALGLHWHAPGDSASAGPGRFAVLALVLGVVGAVHVLVFWYPHWYPETYGSTGLTPFKIAAEYGVIALYAGSLVLLLRLARERTSFDVARLFAAVWVMGLSEFFFTFYVTATDPFNLLGHVYKVVGYYYLYRAIFVGTIEAPYRALKQSDKALRAVLDAVPDLMFEVTRGGRYVEIHTRQPELLLLPAEQVLGRTIHDILPPQAAAVAQRAIDAAAEHGVARDFQYTLDLPDGKHWFELSVARKVMYEASEAHFVVLSRDITQRVQTLDTLRKLRHAVEQAPNSIFIAGADGNIEYVNPAFSVTTGYSLAEVVGRNPRLLSAGGTPLSVYADLWAHLSSGRAWRGEFLNRRKDGREYYESAIISPLHDEQGRITHYLAVQEDVTERKRDEERIRKLVNFDALTGLPNRTMFASRFSQALALTQRSGQHLALLYLDLDHFKNVNDSLGHQVGDELLVEIAHRLQLVLREEDTVSRPGGDEFIIVLPLADAQHAAHVAESLQSEVRRVCRLGHHELVVTSSIGIALYPEDGREFETLAQRADAAMFRAKETGRDTYRFFSADMQAHSLRVLQIENALRSAVVQNQLALHYQPQIRLRDRRLTGVEALLRWTHPELGLISPAEFIPVAESSGQILGIGEWVLRTALAQARAWCEAGHTGFTVAVNLSMVQFRHPGLVEMVQQALADSGVSPQMLELELTESIAMDAPEKVIAIVQQLFDLGVQLSIDDFGTGYSSFSYIQRLRVHKLKIDQSFVRHLGEDGSAQHIVRAIIGLAQSLDLESIAEGVETATQCEALLSLGCNTGQGYYFSRPVPAAQLDAWMTERRVTLV
ncbi:MULTISPECIES: EAL domain-containing protein [unclassified Acidovorax]|uniref:bifunctional diguanylate cyclase/phosphodiesterase n=1 Tax=unclassified Acidovorax TaxID=2684926 RepID=UPI001C4598FD|nr:MULTISPECIES: EAL domain-containing protein [unclassified Acidovorax]MBV7460385.1 EAL domain-containing protein [Acidovorax sp. sif0632]MBV7465410.1 EAL domain-containing protein [Acidovorax sp. sif0613]